MTTIEVTLNDIWRGRRRDCNRCPVALAASRAFGLPVDIGMKMIHIYTEDDQQVVATRVLPREVQAWIASYDCGKKNGPITFKVASVSRLSTDDLPRRRVEDL